MVNKSSNSKIFLFVISFFFLFLLLLLVKYEARVTSTSRNNCSAIRIGAVINQRSRVGKEQRIAMRMAVHDFNHQFSDCPKLVLYLRDSKGKLAGAVSSAIDLVKHKRVEGIIASVTLEEATLISQFHLITTNNITIFTINPTTTSPSVYLPKNPSIFQLSNPITDHMQCVAALIGHFQWRKVTVVYEHGNSLYLDSLLVKQFSSLLKPFNSSIENHTAFPSVSSLSKPTTFVQKELEILKNKSSGVFVVVQSSPKFGAILFEKAKELGMMEKGYAWIVFDDLANLLDSMDPSVLVTMHGVIGLKSSYVDKTRVFHSFRARFRREFRSRYSEEEEEEEEYPFPSFYALRAYDAVWAMSKAMQNSEWKNTSSGELSDYIMSMDIQGLSGEINFKNNQLSQKPTFRIINVIGKSYNEIALWSRNGGFSEDLLDSAYWPGGGKKVPRGWISGGIERRLKVGVLAKSAFRQFVSVTYDEVNNTTMFGGFSIAVFKAATGRLPYQLPYDFIPFNGSSEEIVKSVYNKTLDVAIGDLHIVADRYNYVDFAQPYMDSQIVMIVPARQDWLKQRFIVLKAFTWQLWLVIIAMVFSTGGIIYLNELVNGNGEFEGSFPKIIGSMLWFSVSLLSFSQRGRIKNNMSRLVFAVWLFVVAVVGASFTAMLSSMLTVPQLKPPVLDIEYLQQTNAIIGCNRRVFMARCLTDTLNFMQENVKKTDFYIEYPNAFEKGEILAPFLLSPHAKVFLEIYCNYAMAEDNLRFGSLAFAFPKDERLSLVRDISREIISLKQDEQMNEREKHWLFMANCSSTNKDNDQSLNIKHFFGPLVVSGSISGVVLLTILAHVINKVANWWIFTVIIDSSKNFKMDIDPFVKMAFKNYIYNAGKWRS